MAYGVERKAVTVWSEGSRLAAVAMRPEGAPRPGPAILLCHGWGGLKEHLVDLYGEFFAGAGFICLAFDYRGWGGSDGRLISAPDTPPLTKAGERTVKARVIREVVDPLDQAADVRACLAWLLGEEGVDPARVGLWGSSYGAGLATCVTGADTRVKALVAQIGGYGHPREDWYRDLAHRRMADKARAAIDPPVPQGIDVAPGLRGAPDIARQFGFSPLKAAETVRVPTLFIDAEFEEYNEPALQGGAAFDIVRRDAVAERITFPCTHYQVYAEHLVPARQAALEWFQTHL
ncbi:MAG: alpha/beta hydrolase [Caulobacteraceae bacterium]